MTTAPIWVKYTCTKRELQMKTVLELNSRVYRRRKAFLEVGWVRLSKFTPLWHVTINYLLSGTQKCRNKEEKLKPLHSPVCIILVDSRIIPLPLHPSGFPIGLIIPNRPSATKHCRKEKKKRKKEKKKRKKRGRTNQLSPYPPPQASQSRKRGNFLPPSLPKNGKQK